jgi:hypothetical protein
MPAAATRETGDQCLPVCRVSSVWSQDSVWTPVGPGIGCLFTVEIKFKVERCQWDATQMTKSIQY